MGNACFAWRRNAALRCVATLVLIDLTAALGCSSGGSSSLSSAGAPTAGSVADIPDGDATGARTADVLFSIYVRECDGACVLPSAFGTVSACNVGNRESLLATMTQTNGHVRFDLAESDLHVTRLEGGFYRDGHFEVGGLGTVGEVEVVARAKGTTNPDVNAAQTVEGELVAVANGAANGGSVDCHGVVELTADCPACNADTPCATQYCGAPFGSKNALLCRSIHGGAYAWTPTLDCGASTFGTTQTCDGTTMTCCAHFSDWKRTC